MDEEVRFHWIMKRLPDGGTFSGIARKFNYRQVAYEIVEKILPFN